MPEIFKRTPPQQSTPRDKSIGTSALGTPVYANIIFQAGEYLDDKDDTVTFDELKYDAVLLIVTQTKKIVRTEIAGKNGTVKEYIGLDDYTVQINGVISGLNGVHPTDEKLALKAMLDAPVPIAVSCTYLQDLGINNLVVSSYEFAQQEGGMSYQTFTITCIDDIPTELRIADV